MVKAEGRSSCSRSIAKGGKLGHGNIAGTPPNFDPIVSTGNFKSHTINAPPATASRNPGPLEQTGATR